MGKITKVYIAGCGVGLRLHEPIIKEIGTTYEFVRLPDNHDETKNTIVNYMDGLLIIGTPIYKQKEHLLYGLNHYSTILCEKPCCLSALEIDDVIKLQQRTNAQVFVNYQLRFLNTIPIIKGIITEEDVSFINIKYVSSVRKQLEVPSWYKDKKKGGGVKNSIFSHLIDLLKYLGVGFLIAKEINQFSLDKIDISFESLSGLLIRINIDTVNEYDMFLMEIGKKNKTLLFDLVSDQEVDKTSFCKYLCGALSSRVEGPWRKGFRRLLSEILEGNYNHCKLARLEDALFVHEVLDTIE